MKIIKKCVNILYILYAYHFFLSCSRDKGSNENVKKNDGDEEKGNEDNEGRFLN